MIKGKGSKFNAYARFIEIGINTITAALFVSRLVNKVIRINNAHKIKEFDCPSIKTNRF